jgi:hypothetical protein
MIAAQRSSTSTWSYAIVSRDLKGFVGSAVAVMTPR